MPPSDPEFLNILLLAECLAAIPVNMVNIIPAKYHVLYCHCESVSMLLLAPSEAMSKYSLTELRLILVFILSKSENVLWCVISH